MLSRISNFVGPLGNFFSAPTENELYYGSLVLTNSQKSLILSTSDDYVIGTGDFTLESWFKINNFTGYSGIISTRENTTQRGVSLNITPSGSPSGYSAEFYIGGLSTSYLDISDIESGPWYHVAFCRIGGTLSWYFNGNKINSITDLNDYTEQTIAIGRYYSDYDNYYFDGLISSPKLTIGASLYSVDFTPIPIPTKDSNTRFLISVGDDTNILDSSDYGHSLTKNNINFDDEIPFIEGSFRFGRNDTTERWISLSASSDWAIGNADFSVEWFQYQTQLSPPFYSRLFQVGDWPSHSFAVSIEDGNLLLWLNNGYSYYVYLPLTNPLNNWKHIAISRNAGQVSVWEDGVRIWYNAVYTNISNSTDEFKIGTGSGNVWNGYLTNFRLVTGQSSYTDTATISVPTSPLTSISGTKLLLLFDNPSTAIDSSPYNRTVSNNGATWSGLSPF